MREFKIGADVFSGLRRGEAVIYTPITGDPVAAHIEPIPLSDNQPERIDPTGARHACEAPVHPELTLPDQYPPTEPRHDGENLDTPDDENPFKM